MRKGFLFIGISFIVTMMFILATYQYLPSTVVTQMRIEQLFTQSASLEWEKSSFLLFYLAVLFIVNLFVIILPLLIARKPQLLLKGIGYEKFAGKHQTKPSEQRSPMNIAYSGVFINIILLFAYLMTAHVNGINVFLPYVVILLLFIMAMLWFVFWIVKFITPYPTSNSK